MLRSDSWGISSILQRDIQCCGGMSSVLHVKGNLVLWRDLTSTAGDFQSCEGIPSVLKKHMQCCGRIRSVLQKTLSTVEEKHQGCTTILSVVIEDADFLLLC